MEKDIKKLFEKTGLPLNIIRRAYIDAENNYDAAYKILMEQHGKNWNMISSSNTVKPDAKSLLEKLVIECIQNGVTISGVGHNGKNLEYELDGFSKSGTGILTIDDEDNIILKTRYDTIDIINDFEDIVGVAYDWYQNYSDREPFTSPDRRWLPSFKKYGFISINDSILE